MGLCKTSNFSIFTFINASYLKFCPRSYSSCVYHMMRFKGLDEKVCKMICHTLELYEAPVNCILLYSNFYTSTFVYIHMHVFRKLSLNHKDLLPLDNIHRGQKYKKMCFWKDWQEMLQNVGNNPFCKILVYTQLSNYWLFMTGQHAHLAVYTCTINYTYKKLKSSNVFSWGMGGGRETAVLFSVSECLQRFLIYTDKLTSL